jgi:tetratricopeptide (TPR) repeat protein
MGPVNLNISKSGFGTSIGGKGFRLGVNAKGKSYTSATIPGTGLNYISYGKNNKQSISNTQTAKYSLQAPRSTYNPYNLSSKYFELPSEYQRIEGQNGCLMLLAWIMAIVLCFSLVPLGIITVIALLAYQRKINQKPENIRNTALKEALIMFSKEGYNNIIQKLSPINETIPNDFAVNHLLGLAYYNQDNYEDANTYLNIAKEAREDDFRTIFFLANSNRALKTHEGYKAAIQFYKWLLEKDPVNDEIRFLISNCLFNLNDFNGSVYYLQSISENSPNYLKALNAIAACFIETKQWDLAIEVLKKAPMLKRNLDYDLKSIHYSLALIYEETGEQKLAIKHLNKIYSQDIGYKDISQRLKNLQAI